MSNASLDDTLLLSDTLMMSLAREIAVDFHELDSILSRYGVSQKEFDRLKVMPRFDRLLREMIGEWNAPTNTAERVKLKSQTMIEVLLPELHNRLTDRGESLAAKSDVLKTLRVLGGLGLPERMGEGAGERFSLTINIGDDKRIIDVTPAARMQAIEDA